MNGLWPFLTPSGWFLGLGLFQNLFHNLLIYTNNFCFGYITVSCFFETFPVWLGVGKSDFNENPVVSLDLDFGLRLRVCQKWKMSSSSELNSYQGDSFHFFKFWPPLWFFFNGGIFFTLTLFCEMVTSWAKKYHIF